MPSLTPFPWHINSWNRVAADVLGDRLPHALLLVGREGVGKHCFVEALAGQLLCYSPQSSGACGTCRSCRLYCAGTHPDYLVVSPPPDGRQITVDGIRDCLDFTNLSRHSAKHRVVVIDPADALNRSAANALLKTLEEPTSGTVFLLLTSRPSAILPTIRSRCQRLVLDQLDNEQALSWLRAANTEQRNVELAYHLSGEAPLIAASIDPSVMINRISTAIANLSAIVAKPGRALEIAEQIVSQESGSQFDVTVLLVETMIYKKCAVRDRFSDFSALESRAISEMAEHLDVPALFRIREMLLQQRRIGMAWSGLRERDRLEELLLTVAEVADRRTDI